MADKSGDARDAPFRNTCPTDDEPLTELQRIADWAAKLQKNFMLMRMGFAQMNVGWRRVGRDNHRLDQVSRERNLPPLQCTGDQTVNQVHCCQTAISTSHILINRATSVFMGSPLILQMRLFSEHLLLHVIVVPHTVAKSVHPCLFTY